MVKNSRGMTLVELMVSVAILSIGILGFIGAFRYVSTSIHVSRTRTLATNLAQEKIEVLKNLSYYELRVTTATSPDNNFTPALVYDNSNYPPEDIAIGGISYRRYTRVDLAQIDNDVITAISYTFPDTGMKQITVEVAWNDRGLWRKYGLTNLLENPNINPLDGSLSGSVNILGGGALESAVVRVEENPDWNQASDASGDYSFRVYHGSYTVRASSAGYYDAVAPLLSVPAGTNVSVPALFLQPIGSGTISGNAWMNPDLVISQIALSTAQAGENEYGTPFNDMQVQYVELYNPTTFAMDIAGAVNPTVRLNLSAPNGCTNHAGCYDPTVGLKLVYISTYVAPSSYYLIANTGTFVAGGVLKHADAVYADDAQTLCADPPTGAIWSPFASPPLKMILNPGHGGSVWLERSGSGIIDSVGWTHNANSPIYCETTCIPTPSGGLPAGSQFVRISSPTAALVESQLWTYGRAYDSHVSANDWIYQPLNWTWVAPRATSDAPKPPIAGKPAVGASVASSDPYSGATVATAAYVSSGTLSLLYSPFTLVGVTTSPAAGSCAGLCWVVEIASRGYYTQISTISVSQGITTRVPNADTSPAWTFANLNAAYLSSSSLNGFIKGVVTSVNAAPISGIQVIAGGATKTTGVNGAYFVSTSSGEVYVIVNPNNANTAYVQSMDAVTVQTGEVVNRDFTLTRGGSITGYLTAGTTPLPNFSVVATIGGSQYGSGTSNTSGVFTIRNLSTGTYIVQPALEVGQDSSPNSKSVTVIANSTVFSATFTVGGAFGSLAGTVRSLGAAVTTGALIVASTGPIAATLPAIAASSSPALSPIYAVSSKADGTYSLPVRGSNTYYLSVFLPSIAANGTVSITTKTYSGLYVTPSTVKPHDLTIP